MQNCTVKKVSLPSLLLVAVASVVDVENKTRGSFLA